MYPEAFGAKPEAKPTPEPTVGGQVKEFFKGLAPGAIGLVESAAVGASSLLPEETEKAARESIASIAGAAKKPFEAAPGYEETVGRKFGQAVGSIAPFLGLGPLGLAGRVGMAGLGAGAGAGEARVRAEQEGGMEQRGTATALGAVVGVSEMFAPARILGRVSEPAKAGAVAFVRRALQAGGEEAAQEAAAQAAQNMIAKGLYKPEQEIIEQVGESAAYGGATGALVQGILDLAIGRRAKGATSQDEIQRLHAEEEQRKAAEEARKATPDYAKQVLADFQRLRDERAALVAQQKELDKKDPQRRVLGMQINDLSRELKRIEKDLPQATQVMEAERLKTMSPEEAFLERQGITLPSPIQAAQQVREEDFLPQEPALPTEGPSPAAKYAQERIALAQEQLPAPSPNDYADYLLQDPRLAEQVRQQALRIPGLERKENQLVLDRLNLLEKERASGMRKEMEQRGALLQTAPTPETPQQYQGLLDYLDETKAIREAPPEVAEQYDVLRQQIEAMQKERDAVPKTASMAETKARIKEIEDTFAKGQLTPEEYRKYGKELNKLRNIQTPAQQRLAYDEQIAALQKQLEDIAPVGRVAAQKVEAQYEKAFERPEPPIKAPEGVKYTPNAARVRQTIEKMLADYDQAQEDYASSLRAGRSDAARAAYERGNALLEQLNATAAQRPEGAQTKELKAGVKEPATNTYAQELLKARRAQAEALDRAEDAIDRLRKEDVLGKEKMAGASAAVLQQRVEKARADYIDAVLREAAANRVAYNREALTTDEAVKATSKIYDTFNEWVTRVQAAPRREALQDVIVQPAVMRADKIIRGAITRKMDLRPLEQRRFGAYDKAVQVLKEQLDEARAELEPPPAKLQVEIPILKRQYPALEAQKVAEARGETAKTLEGELRRRTEYVREQIEKLRLPEPITGMFGTEPTKLQMKVAQRGAPELRRMATANVMEKVAKALDEGKATRKLLDAVEPVVSAAAARRQITASDLRAITDALRASEPTAVERKEAGQKQLDLIFEEPGKAPRKIEDDLGYLRASPKNFANSPRIKPVWAALEKARAAQKAAEEKDAKAAAATKARLEQVKTLKEQIANIKANTKFFMTGTTKWTNEQMAEAAVERPDFSTDPAELTLINTYLKGKKLNTFTPEEQATIQRLELNYKQNLKPAYEERVKEALAILKQGKPINAANNRLLAFMQDTNAEIRKQAAELQAELQPLQDVLNNVSRAVVKAEPTRAEQQIRALEKEIAEGRAAYNKATEDAYTRAKAEVDAAYAALFDPAIKEATTALDAAEKTLKKEEAELERIFKRYDAILNREAGADRTQLATYEVFKFEEKMGALEDLNKEIAKLQKSLARLNAQRYEAINGKELAMQAMLDGNVKVERTYLEGLEKRLAKLRGEEAKTGIAGYVTRQEEVEERDEKGNIKLEMRERVIPVYTGTPQVKTLGDYPFTVAKLEKQVSEQRKKLENTIKRADSNKKRVEDRKLTLEDLPGIRVEKGVKTPALTREQKRADALRREQVEALNETQEIARRSQNKQMTLEEIDTELTDAYELFASFDGPVEAKEIDAAINDEARSVEERFTLLFKRQLLTDIRNLEADYTRISEGKPFRPPVGATTASTKKLTGLKAFRTGYTQTLAEVSQGLRAERERGIGSITGELGGVEEDAGSVIGDRAPSFDRLFQMATAQTQGPKLQTPVDTEENAAAVMNNLARSTNDPITRAVASRLKMLLGNTRVELVDDLRMPDGTPAYGEAKVDGSLIRLDKAAGLNEQTVIHEGMHAATERVLRMPDKDLSADQRAAKRELEELYKAFVADPNAPNENARKDVSEFLSESLSDGPLREYLKSKPWTLKNMWESLKNGVLRMLGIDVPKNMLEASLAVADRLMTRVPRPTEADMKLATPSVARPKEAPASLKNALDFANKIVAKQRTWVDDIKANATGLAFETQVVDRFAGFERLAKYMETLRGTQMMYYLRMYDQRMNFTAQAVARGAPQIVEKSRADGKVERVVETQDGPSIKGTVDILKEATPLVGSGENVNRLFTMYMSAIRAKNKGLTALNFSEDITPEALRDALASVDSVPGLKDIFDRARAEYNAYNRNLIKFLASTGAISEKTAQNLIKDDDYIPWYRKQGGVVDLVIGNESPIRIGDIKSKPYLQELVGGDKPILDFMTSSVQNTSMIMDMGLNNLATKNAVYELANIKAAKFVKATEGRDVVRFKEDGVDKYAVLSTEKVKIGNREFDTGVPADILVKGMEGIPTQMPFVFRVLAMPAQLLRKAVTLSPLYMARQLFRDTLAAPMLAGADFVPVFGALKELRSATRDTLEKRGVTGGQQFVGRSEDLSMILRDITENKPGWMQALGKFEAAAMEADALTRRAQYNSYIKQGMSEMEATLMALESMNFNKRGASPSIHMANALIPFFNAQIQGLNVLYRALFGKMPFNDQLKIRQKLLVRGGMMATATLVYAAMMADDEAYENATPDQKYGNWFVRVPGLDEPVKLPVPFEIGYIFKALPEAVFNSMRSDKGAEDAFDAFKTILRQTVPGGSSYGIPQALKPAIEAGLGKSFYTGRDILSAREKELLPEEQFRTNTAEISKVLGKQFGISPVIFESLVSGYTGTLGLAFLQAVSVGVPKSEGPERAVRRLSEYPLVGGAFQPNDAGGIINNVYERMNEAIQVKSTMKKMLTEGRMADAKSLMERKGTELLVAEVGEKFKNAMSKITAAERAIQASNISPEEKRGQLDMLRQLKINYAKSARNLYDQTVSYSSSL